MSRTTCLITGCALVIPHRAPNSYYWGDLHKHSAGVFIFHAVMDGRRATEFSIMADIHQHRRGLVVGRDVDVYEERGVFVMPADPRLLTPEATLYVDRHSAGTFVPMDPQRQAFDPFMGKTQLAPRKTRLLDGEESTL